jgi:hypothetical protein
MNTVPLIPAQGQNSPFGGTLTFWSDSAPSVAPNDPYFLTGVGMVPNAIVWASIPFAVSQDMAVVGTVNADGTFSAVGKAAEPGNVNGLRLARNWDNPFGRFVCSFVAAVAAPSAPAPVPGIPLLVSTVLAHRAAGAQPLVTPANFMGSTWAGSAPVLTYTNPTFGLEVVPYVWALDAPTAGLLASLLGATVEQALPPFLPASAVVGPQPLVAWLVMPAGKCCAGDLATELLVNFLDAASLTAVVTGMFT